MNIIMATKCLLVTESELTVSFQLFKPCVFNLNQRIDEANNETISNEEKILFSLLLFASLNRDEVEKTESKRKYRKIKFDFQFILNFVEPTLLWAKYKTI